MMFSSGLAKTFPFVSHAIQVGGSEGRTKIMGPTTSAVASAVTQLSSSAGASSSGLEAGVVRALEVEEPPNLSSTLTRLRFLGLGSPLNVRSLPIIEVVRWLLCLALGRTSKCCRQWWLMQGHNMGYHHSLVHYNHWCQKHRVAPLLQLATYLPHYLLRTSISHASPPEMLSAVH